MEVLIFYGPDGGTGSGILDGQHRFMLGLHSLPNPVPEKIRGLIPLSRLIGWQESHSKEPKDNSDRLAAFAQSASGEVEIDGAEPGGDQVVQKAEGEADCDDEEIH